jgi:galactokinase/tRNA pseudouridine(38-40) synthase
MGSLLSVGRTKAVVQTRPKCANRQHADTVSPLTQADERPLKRRRSTYENCTNSIEQLHTVEIERSDAILEPADATARARPIRHKKRKVVLFIGYNGMRYSGMQVNPGVISIESALFDSLLECGLVSSTSKDTMREVQWSRAARTDKGVSAACQCVSLKLPCEMNGKIDQTLISRINSQLPGDIVLHDIRRATNSFNARNDCYRRRYEYIFPVKILDGAHGVRANEIREGKGDLRVHRLNVILSQYEGTHCFANFTEGLKGSDDSARRFIIEVQCGEPFLPPGSNQYFCTVNIYGQSFVLYQIRKMIGLALAIYLGILPPETLAVALSPHSRIMIPTAPALGLFLESLEFDSYNKQVGRDLLIPIAVDGTILEKKNDFKQNVIYRDIAAQEMISHPIETWIQSLATKWKVDTDSIMRDHHQFIVTSEGIANAQNEKVANQFPVTQSVAEFFTGDRNAIIDPHDQERLNELLAAFDERFHMSAKQVVRTPGRVNLIGEHCDYNDFPVIGVATRQGTLIASSDCSDRNVSVQHLDRIQFASGSFTSVGDMCIEKEGQSCPNAEWIRYVSWGWKAFVNSRISVKRTARPCGALLLVSGDLPRAVGLGSSSSLVTAATLMCARLNRTRMGREETALTAAEGERRGAGTRGGAVDHTVSMCGVKGCAVFVTFSPKLETSTLQLPHGCSFVVVNSGVKAFKGQNEVTKTLYNTRVAECRIGSALVARRLHIHLSRTVSSPGQMYNMAKAGGQVSSVRELHDRMLSVLGPDEEITFEAAVSEIGLSVVEVRNRFFLGTEFADPRFKIGKRLRHVFSEAARVDRFRDLLSRDWADVPLIPEVQRDSAVIDELGHILSASHTSLRDQYECSCPEVDRLVAYCMDHGSVGSRITGAGWGGCILSLVPSENLSSFVDALGSRLGRDSVFVVDANAGSSVLSL